MNNNEDLVYSYTRKQAIEDGVLVDVTLIAKEVGFVIPVAVTRELYEKILNPNDEDKDNGQSFEGRLWDLLSILFVECRSCNTNILKLRMDVQYSIRTKTEEFKAIFGPGDTLDPVLTVMLPHED